jgi:hypothetical protein
MARNWDSLSDSYRHRLERNGVSRDDYESGQSLSVARGHGLNRDALIAEIQGYKRELHDGARRWNESKSLKHIVKSNEGEIRTVAQLREIAKAYRQTKEDSQTRAEWQDSLFFQLSEDDLEDAGFYN